MLEIFKKFESLGTPKYFYEVCSKLNTNKNRKEENINEYFHNKTIEGRYIFDGGLTFLKTLGIISEENGTLSIDSYFGKLIKDPKQFNIEILNEIIKKFKDDEIFKSIFSAQYISYDIINKLIQIKNCAFKFTYSNFKQLLIDFNFLSLHPNGILEKLIINPKYKDLFDQQILPDIRKRTIGLDELKLKLARQQALGQEAELFVLEYENKRLINGRVAERISPYDVSAGYDILSYHTNDSIKQDRFIEVKSFSGEVSFYFTRNEINSAMVRKDDYYLYLINRDEIGEVDYKPIIIKNPYESILKSEDWIKEIDCYYISYSK